ncbi:MAG: ROK family protein [Lachnospiraceae bacterium]|nr:ROK family protein [Lachnospiraceae bacterium]
MFTVAIDIGGTNTRVALVDENLKIIKRTQFSTDTTNPEHTLDEIVEVIRGYGNDIQAQITGIGMSCPGPLDLIHGKILTPPNLTGGWHNYMITDALKAKTGLPVYLDNDANLAALAEATVGEGKDYRYVQFLTISTGLGAGFVIDKEIYLGAHGFANEVANTIMIQDGPSHGSIIPGGVEAICSGTAIVERAKKAGIAAKHAGEVNDLALEGNENAKQIMDDAKNYLANFVAFIYAFADPEIVILGGSVAIKIEGFVEEVEELVKTKVYPNMIPYINIRKTTLDEDSGLLGGGILAYLKRVMTEK